MNDQNLARYWDQRSKTWSGIPEPLKPTDEDISVFNVMLSKYSKTNSDALILGATPKLYTLDQGLERVCVDISQSMILENHNENVRFVQGNWLHMPFIPSNSIGYVVGDGVLTLLKFREQYEMFFKELHRVMELGAVFIVRVFARSIHLALLQGNEHVDRFKGYMAKSEDNLVVDHEFDITYSFPDLIDVIDIAAEWFPLMAIEFPHGNVNFPILCFVKS